MREYQTSIFMGFIYIVLFALLPSVRTITFITVIFLALHLAFHGVLTLLGKRAAKLHDKFVETHLATISVLGLYSAAAGLFFYIRHLLV